LSIYTHSLKNHFESSVFPAPGEPAIKIESGLVSGKQIKSPAKSSLIFFISFDKSYCFFLDIAHAHTV